MAESDSEGAGDVLVDDGELLESLHQGLGDVWSEGWILDQLQSVVVARIVVDGARVGFSQLDKLLNLRDLRDCAF